MKLYYSPGTCSMAVWITLDWAQADYEVEKVELGSEEYKKINPSGTVPAIDSGEGKLKTQLPALIQYINRLYPEANLGPDEGSEAIYEYEEILAFLSSDIHPSFGPIFGPGSFTKKDGEEDIQAVQDAAYEKIDGLMTNLDQRLEGKDHLYRDKKTALDAVAYIFAGWTELCPKTWRQYPNLAAFMEKVSQDESVKKIQDQANK